MTLARTTVARVRRASARRSIGKAARIAWTAALVLLAAGAALAQAPALRNPGFDAADPLDGWSLHVYGARPSVASDAEVRTGGTASLRISCAEPTDTALGQEIALRPGAFYRLTGMVRTRDLLPVGAPVYGTLQVQAPGGGSVIASGRNHGGDTDWTPVSVAFRAPADGLTRIAVFFAGYGKGTGTAWFDDIRLQEEDVSMAPIRVTREPIGRRISPLQYGQFVEYLCDLVPGMWSELLCDGSFEGITPYIFEFVKETDSRERPWYPFGSVNRGAWTRDRSEKISGDQSMRVEVGSGPPATVGIAQNGVAVRRGERARFTCWLRRQGGEGPVTVALRSEGRVIASAELPVSTGWARVEAWLAPTRTDSAAVLSLTFRGPGTLWLDSASLMPEHTCGGWRPDVVEAVRALRPGVIRFGGSVVDAGGAYGDFDWRDTIGDPDRRRPVRAWGGLQQAGAGLEEFVRFCRLVGAEPLICVRTRERRPKDAADEVEYFNGAADTPMGKLRAANGHPEPYRVLYWQVGNEVGGPGYEAALPGFCEAMKAIDPSIRLLSSFPTPSLLRVAGKWIDYVCPHHYGCANLGEMQSDFDEIRRMIAENAPGRDIRVGVTEWNTTAGDWGPARASLWTLRNALDCARYHNLMHRNADLVEIANRSNLTNSFCSGIIQTDASRLYTTPTYFAQKLYAGLAGVTPLRVDGALADEAPDVSATLSKDGRTVTVFAVNDGPDRVERILDATAARASGESVDVWMLADRDRAGEPDVTNSFGDPKRVAPVRSHARMSAGKLRYTFAAWSITVLRWRVRP